MQSHYLTQMDPKTISHSVNNYLVSTWPMQARRESPSPLPQPHASSALLSPTQALRRGGWKASFEELDDVDRSRFPKKVHKISPNNSRPCQLKLGTPAEKHSVCGPSGSHPIVYRGDSRSQYVRFLLLL